VPITYTLRVPRVIVHRVPIDPCTGADMVVPAEPAVPQAVPQTDSPLRPIPETQPSILQPTPAPQTQPGAPRTFAPQSEAQPTPMPQTQPAPQTQPQPRTQPARPEPETPQPRIEPGEETNGPNVNATFRSTFAPLVPVSS